MSALQERDTNLQTTSEAVSVEKDTSAGQENKMQEIQQHKTVLERKIAENNVKPGQTYISPSDAILSPASQKLADLKQRQMNKSYVLRVSSLDDEGGMERLIPNTIRSGSKTPLARSLFGRTMSSCSTGFDDVEDAEEKH